MENISRPVFYVIALFTQLHTSLQPVTIHFFTHDRTHQNQIITKLCRITIRDGGELLLIILQMLQTGAVLIKKFFEKGYAFFRFQTVGKENL